MTRRSKEDNDEFDVEVANYYKQKIDDLEADCSAGLNRIRSRYSESSNTEVPCLDLNFIKEEDENDAEVGNDDESDTK